jgi:hypothetical protein
MQQLELFNTTLDQTNTNSLSQTESTKNSKTFSIQLDPEFILDGEIKGNKHNYHINLKYYDKTSGGLINEIDLFLNRDAVKDLHKELEKALLYPPK